MKFFEVVYEELGGLELLVGADDDVTGIPVLYGEYLIAPTAFHALEHMKQNEPYIEILEVNQITLFQYIYAKIMQLFRQWD